MSRFVDTYLPPETPGYPCVSTPRWSTSITQADSGAEQVLERWESPLHTFTLPDAVRSQPVFEAVKEHWYAMRGRARTFPFRDPNDFASRRLVFPNEVPPIAATDQVIGTGDGVTTQFQLVKRYTSGPATYVRPIRLPVVASVLVAINGAPPGSLSPPRTFTVNRQTGIVTFNLAPPAGSTITAGFLFDVEVRFEADDAFEAIVQTYRATGFASLTLVEVRGC